MKALEEIIIDAAHKNSIKWNLTRRNRVLDRDDVADYFTRFVKYPRDREGDIIDAYSPTLKPEFMITKDDSGLATGVITGVFDALGKPLTEVNELTIPRMGWAQTILRATHIWISNGLRQPMFGVKWVIEQLKVYYPDAELPIGKCLISDDSEDDEEY